MVDTHSFCHFDGNSIGGPGVDTKRTGLNINQVQ